MWRCFGALERLSAKMKRRALNALLESAAKLQDHHWWVMARLGARRLLYGPANAVIPAASIGPLISGLLARAGESKSRSALLAVAVDFDRVSAQCSFNETRQHHSVLANLTRSNRVEEPDNRDWKLIIPVICKRKILIDSL